MKRKGFTLLELLIVIAILVVLATVAVLVINPLEYLKQSRDAKRVADIVALNKTLGLAEFNNLNMGGASTTVFVSLTDSSPTCANLGLPALPTDYQYNCITTAANLKKTDGTGWIPVNLESMVGGTPLATLPIDPTNDATKFYTYIPGGSFALSATLESDKYLKQSALADGGTNPTKIETGSDLKLLTKSEGLVGYWPFDEGSGTVANDVSGSGNNGSLINGPTWVAGKVGGALNFNGSNHYALMNGSSLDINNNFSIGVWIKTSVSCATASGGIIAWGEQSLGKRRSMIIWNPSSEGACYPYFSGWGENLSGNIIINDNIWHYIVTTLDSSSNAKIYVDGVLTSQGAVALNAFTYGGTNIGRTQYPEYLNGSVDESRIYNRVLSASEIQAIYNATK